MRPSASHGIRTINGGRGWSARSCLLPQPNCVEGFRALPEVLQADHLVAPEGPHVEVAELGGGAASAPNSALAHGRDDRVPRIGDLLRFDRDAGPGLKKASRVLREALEAKVGSGVGKFGRITSKTSGFTALTEPGELAKWWGPSGFTSQVSSLRSTPRFASPTRFAGRSPIPTTRRRRLRSPSGI